MRPDDDDNDPTIPFTIGIYEEAAKLKKDQMQSQQYSQEALILPKYENGYLNKVV